MESCSVSYRVVALRTRLLAKWCALEKANASWAQSSEADTTPSYHLCTHHLSTVPSSILVSDHGLLGLFTQFDRWGTTGAITPQTILVEVHSVIAYHIHIENAGSDRRGPSSWFADSKKCSIIIHQTDIISTG